MAGKRIFGSLYLFNYLKEAITFHVKWFKNNGGDNLWALESATKRGSNLSTLQALPVSVYPVLDVFIEDWFNSRRRFGPSPVLWCTSYLSEKYTFDSLFRIAKEKMNLKETARSFAKEIALIEEFVETGEVDKFKLNRGIKKAQDKTNKNPKSKEFQVIRNFLEEVSSMVEGTFKLCLLTQIEETLDVDFEVDIAKEFTPLKFEEFLMLFANKVKKTNFDMWAETW